MEKETKITVETSYNDNTFVRYSVTNGDNCTKLEDFMELVKGIAKQMYSVELVDDYWK